MVELVPEVPEKWIEARLFLNFFSSVSAIFDDFFKVGALDFGVYANKKCRIFGKPYK